MQTEIVEEMSNPWLNRSRWMKDNNSGGGTGRDLSQQSDSESETSNNENGEYEWVLGKKMNSLREELQGWKSKCLKMEEDFKMDKEKWKKLFVAKQAELNWMKNKLGKMGEDLKQSHLEREKLECKSDRLDKLIRELEKLGMTGLVNEFDSQRLSVDEVNRSFRDSEVNRSVRDSEGCSVSDRKETEKLMNVGMDDKGKLREMKPQAGVFVTSLSKKYKILQCNNTDNEDNSMDVGIQAKGILREAKPQAEVSLMNLSKKDNIWQDNNTDNKYNPMDLTSLSKKDKMSQCNNTGNKDNPMDRGIEVQGKLREVKPQAEVSLTTLTVNKGNLMDIGVGAHGKLKEVKPQAKVSSKGLTDNRDNLMKVGAEVKGILRQVKPQAEVSLTNISKKDKISQSNNTDNKELMEVGKEVKGKSSEMKPHSEIMLTSLSQKDRMPEDNNILQGTQIGSHCTIATQSEGRAGEKMLKRGFEDFDRWMGEEPERKLRRARSNSTSHFKMDKIPPSNNMLEGTGRRPHYASTIPTSERGGKTQGEDSQDTKEQDKSGEDGQLQGASKEVEVQARCKRQDGKQWRCSFFALPGRSLCDKHLAQAQHKSWKNKKGDCESGNSKKPKKGMSNITEGKQSLNSVAKHQQENMKKCRSEDEEEDISDSEEELPKKKKSRLKEEEEEDPDYSPTTRRKQKYEKLELLPNGSMALDAGHEKFRKDTCSDLGKDRFTTGRGRWDQKNLISRDGQMKLSTQVLFASFDQRSERAAGESACSALVAVIADWLHKNKNSMPTKALFDTLIREGSLKWRNLCQNPAYKQRFPDRHFDLETVLDAKVCPLSLAPDKSFVGFFQPEKMGDSFEFLQDSMSFDNIWEEITNGALSMETENSGPQIYIVIWNDHFFLLKVEKEAYYIIDTLGERLFEGCNQAYILKFDESTTVYQLPEERKGSTTTQSASIDISKPDGNKHEHGNAKIRNTSPVKIADSNDVKGKLICKGKESCKEFIKGFWAALTLRELEIDIKRGLLGGIQPYQRLQIEFQFTVRSLSTSTELIAGKARNQITLSK